MENAYGIGITNRYALFLDEESDPLDILKASEADKLVAKAKKIEAVTKPAAKSAPKKEAGNNKNDAGKFLLHQYLTYKDVMRSLAKNSNEKLYNANYYSKNADLVC